MALGIAAVAVVGLVLAGRGLQETQLGVTQIAGLPSDSQPRRAQDAAAEGFAPGILSPTVVLVENAGDAGALGRFGRALAEEPGVAAAIGPSSETDERLRGLLVTDDGDAARFLVILAEEPQGGPAIEAVEALRDRLPGLLADAGLGGSTASLAGDTALAQETVDTITDDLIRIGIVAFLVNFVFLAIFLRAIVAPLYLVLASTLGLAATIGLTTLVFQGFLGHGELTYHVPFAVAVCCSRWDRTTTCSSSGGSGRRPRTSRCARRSPPRRRGLRAQSVSPGSRSRSRSRRSRSSTCASSASSRSRCASAS